MYRGLSVSLRTLEIGSLAGPYAEIGMGGVLVPNRWTIMEQEIYIDYLLTINSIHNTNFIKHS